MRVLLTSLVTALLFGGFVLGLGVFLQASAQDHADTQKLALALSVLLAVLLGGAAGWVGARRARVHEQALAALERAAERVAQGDLTSEVVPITVEGVGERADQTFRTFDRMTRELRDMRTRLAQTERETAFRDVAQRIAHEIRNPLLPIRVSIESMRKAKERQSAEFEEIFEESTRTVLDEVQRLQRIVQDFAEFARLPKARPGAVDLVALVTDALSLYSPEGVKTTFAIDSTPSFIRADREQLVQVVVNLLNNAADAVRDRPQPELHLSISATDDGALLHVDDNGPGVAEADRARIFEPYFTTKRQGQGLGLAIAERIAREHGGKLSVTVSPLGGARFTLALSEQGPAA